MRLIACALALVITLVLAGDASARRFALVIGNSAYTHAGPLKNPRNDAADMADILRRNGFDVVDGIDLARAGMELKIRDFVGRIQDAEVALLFYAGHGLQVSVRNYLVPIDARLEQEIDLDFEAIALDPILRQMEVRARRSIVLLDACRNNPFTGKLQRNMGARSVSIGQGLAEVTTSFDALIGFAAAPGAVAFDGAGRNSPYTAGLKKHLAAPGRDLLNALIQVRNDVLKETAERQRPWEHTSLTETLYIAGAPAPGTLTYPAPSARRWWGDAPMHVCDRLASHPDDPHRTTTGVKFEDMDEVWAVRACAEAVAIFPGEPRFEYQLARAYQRARQCDRAKPIFEDLSRRGYTSAINNLATIYETGCAGAKDQAMAVELYREGVEAGDLYAQQNLARHLMSGEGVERNVAEAVRLLETAAEKGHASSLLALARLRYEGREIEKDEPKAIELLRRASAAGETRAMTILGDLLLDRAGEQDVAEAVTLIRQAVAAGEARAAAVLARLHETGRGVTKDEREALRLYTRAVQLGDRMATLNLAYRYRTGTSVQRDARQAMLLYQQAAEAGFVEGNHYLADMLARGEGTDRNTAEAVRYYRRAAEANYTYSLVPLARLLARGEGTARDEAEAKRLVARAEASRNIAVWEDAALAYETGDAIPKDLEKAFALHRKAADAGVTDAMISVARFVDRGIATGKNPLEAGSLYVTAIARLVPEAREEALASLLASPPPFSDEARREMKRRLAAQGLYSGSAEDPAVDASLLDGLRRLPRTTAPRPRPN